MASSPSWQIGETWKQWQIFMGSKISADSDCSHEVKRHLLLERKAMTNLDSMLKNRDISLSTMVHTVKAMVFPNLVQMWELDHKSGWAPKNWYFRIAVLEKNLESLLDSKEIKTVKPKGNQPWIFTARTDAEVPILWPPDMKSRLIEKDADAGKDWSQNKKGEAEDKMVRQYHHLSGHKFEQTLGVNEGSLIQQNLQWWWKVCAVQSGGHQPHVAHGQPRCG